MTEISKSAQGRFISDSLSGSNIAFNKANLGGVSLPFLHYGEGSEGSEA